MEINITADASDHVKFMVNGVFAGELAVKELIGHEALKTEVSEARASVSLLRTLPALIVRLRAMTDKDAAKGLLDGLLGKTEPHPSEGNRVPPIATVHTREAREAYEIGEYLARCSRFAKDGDTLGRMQPPGARKMTLTARIRA